MKSFDEFVGIVASDYKEIEDRAAETEKETLGDHTRRMLRASAEETMELLRRYHEWANG